MSVVLYGCNRGKSSHEQLLSVSRIIVSSLRSTKSVRNHDRYGNVEITLSWLHFTNPRVHLDGIFTIPVTLDSRPAFAGRLAWAGRLALASSLLFLRWSFRHGRVESRWYGYWITQGSNKRATLTDSNRGCNRISAFITEMDCHGLWFSAGTLDR